MGNFCRGEGAGDDDDDDDVEEVIEQWSVNMQVNMAWPRHPSPYTCRACGAEWHRTE